MANKFSSVVLVIGDMVEAIVQMGKWGVKLLGFALSVIIVLSIPFCGYYYSTSALRDVIENASSTVCDKNS